MGPYPHDAPPATISDDNPMGTDGFEFVEYASTEPEKLCRLFETMGFAAVAKHRSKDVTLYRQGDVNFVVNAEPDSFARRFAELHGPCACAMAFRVVDAAHAFERAVALGAKPVETKVGPDGAEHPGGRGHRRLAALLRRPLWRKGLDLGRRFPLDRRARSQARGCRAVLHRPPDPQRLSRQHGEVGRLVRAALQLPADPLLQHRGQADRPQLQGDVQPVRAHPHPDQRECRREKPDRGVSARLSGRRHPARRLRLPRHLRQRADPARARRRVHAAAARGLLREGRRAPAGPRRAARSPARPWAS